jgi:WD40 repeat protein
VDTQDGGRIVAVKQINLRGLSAQEIIEATDGFNREVSLLSSLRHQSLPEIRDTFTDPEHWYVVMDFIAGATLEEYFQSRAEARLPLREVLEIGLQLCDVLKYLHESEPPIIFRDLKPSNIMRTPQGRIYLIDFGIARLFSPGKLKDTMPFGSPGYAAPEQYGRAQTTPQADLYSLGALLHHLLTGADPAESPFRFAPLPIGESAELAELDALLQRMLATDPPERPASAREVRDVLFQLAEKLRQKEHQAMLANIPRPLWTPPAPTPPRAGTTRRRVLIRALKIGGGLVATAGVLTVCSAAFTFLENGERSGIHGSVAGLPPSPGTALRQFVYRGHTGAITALSWSPDATMVASGSADGTVQVWRASDGALLYKLSGYTDAVTSISWASDRVNVIASAGNDNGTVQVWDALRDHRDRIWQGDGRVLALDWQKDSPWIVSGGTDQDIYTWNASSGKKGASYHGHKGNVNALLWLASGKVSATPVANHAIFAQNTTPTPAPVNTPVPPPTPTPAQTAVSGYPPTPTPTLPTLYSNAIASGGADGTVQLWDAHNGAPIATYTDHRGPINGLTFVQYEPYAPTIYLASASDDGTVRVWTPSSNGGFGTLAIYNGHRGKRVNAVTTFAPQFYYYQKLIASAGDDQSVQVWSYRDDTQPLISYTAHTAPVKALAASPTDKRIVSGDSVGLVHLWTITGLA